jgi:hypothetical protein
MLTSLELQQKLISRWTVTKVFNLNGKYYVITTTELGPLSPWHGASSACEWPPAL